MKILIVDDSKDNLTIASDTVQYTDNEPLTASNGYDALDIIAETGVQFLIVDWMMPEMDGIELVRRVRAQFSERYIYIIMLTARDAPEDVVEGLENGADDYIAKPFRPREMRARIKTGIRIINMESRLKDHLTVMENLATHDHLTRLYNRRRFRELAEDALTAHETLSLFMLDIDHFKEVNDSYGHIAGDKVLQQVAETCEKQIEGQGVIGRYGGEEFIGFLPGCDLTGARAFAEALRQRIADTQIDLTVEYIKITVSIGLAARQPEQSLDDLIQQADAALYRAKSAGRNRVEVAEAE